MSLEDTRPELYGGTSNVNNRTMLLLVGRTQLSREEKLLCVFGATELVLHGVCYSAPFHSPELDELRVELGVQNEDFSEARLDKLAKDFESGRAPPHFKLIQERPRIYWPLGVPERPIVESLNN